MRTATAGGIRRVDLESTIFVNELVVIVILSPFSHLFEEFLWNTLDEFPHYLPLIFE